MEGHGKKQIKALGEHGKQLVEFNELVKKDFNINRIVKHLMNKEKYLRTCRRKIF